MGKVAIITDSNSGITQTQAKELGIHVIPMPFFINEQLYFEDITLTQEQFYEELKKGGTISTSQPAVGDILDLWDKVLNEYDEIVHIPMSSGLTGSVATAMTLAQDYDGRVQVVDNQRISVTQRTSVLDAIRMAENGFTAAQIKEKLERTKFDSSIYIMVDTLTYLKKGGRLTPAVAAIGTLLKLKPVLQIHGEKLDAYHNARSVKLAKKTMIDAIRKDSAERLSCGENAENCHIHLAYSGTDTSAIEQFREEVMAAFPGHAEDDFHIDPLSLSVSCHIGPGAIAVTVTKKLYE